MWSKDIIYAETMAHLKAQQRKYERIKFAKRMLLKERISAALMIGIIAMVAVICAGCK